MSDPVCITAMIASEIVLKRNGLNGLLFRLISGGFPSILSQVQ